ncbi:MAG: CHAP domain-containing protein [Gaiellales bacterium]
MGYESALQRVGELRALTGNDLNGSSSTSAAPAGAFQAQLAQEQARLGLSADGGGSSSAQAPLAEYGVPVLTVADQYRMLGIPVPTAGLPGGFGGMGGGPVGQRMVALAQQELASNVRETHGNNESPRIREYRTATAGAENTPGPWCAYFVSWLAQSAGAPIGAGGNGTGYVPTLEAWGRQEGRYTAAGQGTPAPGDIAIINWNGRGVADHTGIVERVDPDGTVHTIEGNSSDTIKRREYGAGSAHVQGYVRVG